VLFGRQHRRDGFHAWWFWGVARRRGADEADELPPLRTSSEEGADCRPLPVVAFQGLQL